MLHNEAYMIERIILKYMKHEEQENGEKIKIRVKFDAWFNDHSLRVRNQTCTEILKGKLWYYIMDKITN